MPQSLPELICIQSEGPLRKSKHPDKPQWVTKQSRSRYMVPLKRCDDPKNDRLRYDADVENMQFLINQAEWGISYYQFPTANYGGEPATYEVLDRNNNPIGIFKPMDEQAGRILLGLNHDALPSKYWPKCLRSRLSRSTVFERSCFIYGHGYMAEVGASLVDEMFGFEIVPTTRLVWLRSPSFQNEETDRLKLKPKCGSFQTLKTEFGYKTPDVYYGDDDYGKRMEEETDEFFFLLQKMFVLDYIIRNVNRTDDNWLLRYNKLNKGVWLAATNHAFSFPYKHPEEVLTEDRYPPFEHHHPPLLQRPFLVSLRDHLLPKLNDISFIDKVCRELRLLFSLDPEFHPLYFEGQMEVMLGQLWNLREALINGETPMQLSRKMPVLVNRRRQLRLHSVGRSWQNTFRIRPIVDAKEKPELNNEK